MKLKELKHNHSLTDLLKVLIFSILMITPLLSVATRCLYVICNKNAYQSAEITQTTYNKTPLYTTNNPLNEFIEGNTYLFQIALNSNIQGDYEFEIISDSGLCQIQFYNTNLNEEVSYQNFNILDNNFDFLSLNLNDLVNGEIQITLSSDSPTEDDVFFYRTIYKSQLIENCYINFYFTILELPEEFYIDNTYYNFYELPNEMQIYQPIEVENTTLDNVFEYSVNKLAQSPILSWTQQTAIYTGVNTMTTQLGVNTPTIPMLIVYWFLLTVIYIIIDIIIKLFTWLTHMIGNKAV